MKNVLIIGSGITGSTIANLFENNLINISFKIFEKSNRPGGRMSTTISRKKTKNYADLGFKFITCQNYNFIPLKYDMSYPNLLKNQLIKTSNNINNDFGSVKYLSTNGFESLVKFFTRNIEIDCNHKVESINFLDNNKIEVTGNFKTENFDYLISTIPIPQLLQLNGNFREKIKESQNYDLIKSVKYDSKLALGLLYDNLNNKFYTEKFENKLIEWIYTEDNKVIIHTNSNWSNENFNNDKEIILEQIENDLFNIFPYLRNHVPSEKILKKWRYSQIINDTDNQIKFLQINNLIVCGDGIAGNGYENCVNSGYQTFKKLENLIR
tara:strand:+ start:1277 stop:2248 length:972 start_codon:yes stop_codon:yes gene_type:complete